MLPWAPPSWGLSSAPPFWKGRGPGGTGSGSWPRPPARSPLPERRGRGRVGGRRRQRRDGQRVLGRGGRAGRGGERARLLRVPQARHQLLHDRLRQLQRVVPRRLHQHHGADGQGDPRVVLRRLPGEGPDAGDPLPAQEVAGAGARARQGRALQEGPGARPGAGPRRQDQALGPHVRRVRGVPAARGLRPVRLLPRHEEVRRPQQDPPEVPPAPVPAARPRVLQVFPGFAAPDVRLRQELCAGAFDEHGLPWLSDAEDGPYLEAALRKRAVKVKHVKRRDKKSDKKKEERYKRHKQKTRHRERSRHSERPDARDPGGLAQCLGPGCTRPARPPSKYCGEACGIKLAANRIYEILPQRIQQWQQSPCVAEEHGKRLLERIRREQHQARLRLQDMERRFHELEGLIARAKGHPPREDEETNEGDSDDTDLQIFCVSCGHPINPKVALRHMERCYAKYESQTSFGSMYPTRIEGATRLFCDVYNPQSKTYCKRLQVLCPEHSRDPKVPADEVCGCPLVRDVFELTGEFCRAPKRKCNRHYCWEKLRRAEVDLERVRVWYKLDELFEQERNVRAAMTNRAGLLALMLHQTIQHDPLTTDLRTAADR
ncbi:CXXC-type zinc finger protein 1 isoform X2 [Struthio camelus]|uniref:CXXC-type zinc finger protein 1 isoform X2 n=1 Tax=Struthio camelus TaxID=8801 RepID=UPI003603FCF2